MPEMNWLEWLKAEGFLQEMDAGVQQALHDLLEAQKGFQELSGLYKFLGLNRDSPVTLDVMVESMARAARQDNAEKRLLAAVLLQEARRLQRQIRP